MQIHLPQMLIEYYTHFLKSTFTHFTTILLYINTSTFHIMTDVFAINYLISKYAKDMHRIT